jgi:hypothetical protein
MSRGLSFPFQLYGLFFLRIYEIDHCLWSTLVIILSLA